MLKISPRTFARMSEHEEGRFIARLAGFLREKVPGLANEPPAALDHQCRMLAKQARSHDMTSEQAIAAFVMTAAILGVDFVDRFPAVRQILFRPVPQERKAELLQGFTIKLLDTLRR